MHHDITAVICHPPIHIGYIIVNGLNIMSNNIEGYEATINFIGPEYNHCLVCFKLKYYISNSNLNDIIQLISIISFKLTITHYII